jgi:hypothetical protein
MITDAEDIRGDIKAAMEGTLGDASDDAALVEDATPAEGAGGDTGPGVGADAAGGAPAAGAGAEGGAESAASAAARARDGKGRFAPKGAAAPAPAAVAAKATAPTAGGAAPKAGEAAAKPGEAPASAAPVEGIKAPQALKPLTRENWDKLPKPLQEEIVQYERQVKSTLQETANARRFSEAVQSALSPHTGFIQREGGGDPIRTISSLLQTAQALQGSNKEAVLAHLIIQTGANVDRLAKHLDGSAQPAAPAQGEYRDPRVDQLLARAEAVERERQARHSEQAQADMAAFREKAEFIEGVREDMAVLLESRRAKTLDEAYERACWSDPTIRGILQQREAAKAANAGNASTQRARAAAASVRSQPATASAAVQSKGSVTEDLKEVWEKLNSR